MSLITALSDRWDLALTGERSNRTLGDVPATFALTPGSRFEFDNPTNNVYITGISDTIKFMLSDAIVSLAGSQGVLGAGTSPSFQDKFLGEANLTAPFAQTAYVSD
jgi:hypothetical protein